MNKEYFNFDPVAAMAAHKRDQEVDRRLRKKVLFETERIEATEPRKAAQKEWESFTVENSIPRDGSTVEKTKDGIQSNLHRIALLPTKEISTLSFKRAGPPKRQLHKFNLGKVIFRNVGEVQLVGEKWQGYVESSPYRQPLASHSRMKVFLFTDYFQSADSLICSATSC